MEADICAFISSRKREYRGLETLKSFSVQISPQGFGGGGGGGDPRQASQTPSQLIDH